MKKKPTWKISKTVLPQDSDHAGVMWHGNYFYWLEECRINALSEVGINYFELTKKGYEFPLIDSSIKYIKPLFLGDKIEIESVFHIANSPKINVESNFFNIDKKLVTKAEVNLVLVNKSNFSIVRKRPEFITKAFSKLSS